MPSLPTNKFWDHAFTKYFENMREGGLTTFENEITKYSRRVYQHIIWIIICLPIVIGFGFGCLPLSNQVDYLIYLGIYKIISLPLELLLIDSCFPGMIKSKMFKYVFLPCIAAIVVSSTEIGYIISVDNRAKKFVLAMIPLLSLAVLFLIYTIYVCCKHRKISTVERLAQRILQRVLNVFLYYF